jgi:hypothetical protein
VFAIQTKCLERFGSKWDGVSEQFRILHSDRLFLIIKGNIRTSCQTYDRTVDE